MDSIFVTGGAGFIGSHFVRQWLAEEDGLLVNLDKLTYAGNLESLGQLASHPRHVFIRGDVGNGGLVYELLVAHRCRAIVHLAAETHVDRSIEGPAAFVQTNVTGTFQLLEAARRYWQSLSPSEKSRFRFVHVSTDEVYGSLGPEGAWREDAPYAPNSPYAASKAAADHFARAYHRTYGLPVIITHSSNNYGPYQFPEKLIPVTIVNAMEGRPLPVYGDGQHVRDWLFVEDHCRALRAVLAGGTPGEVYNIAGGQECTNLQLVQQITEIVDRLLPDLSHKPTRSLITFVPDRPGHDRRYAMDCSKIRTQLGWRPRMELNKGLEQTVRWYVENQTWLKKVRARSSG